jgi:hypothetical protein
MATTAVLTLKVDAKQLQRGILQAEAQVGKLEKRSLGISRIMGVIFTGAMAKAGWSMIKMASDAEETESKFKAVFKGIEADSAIVADSIADKFGLADSTIQEMLSSTGDLLTGFGFARGEALSLSAGVAELAVDLKSFQNFSGGAKGASEAITKALLGETESMKSLGVVIRQDTKLFKAQITQIMRATGATEQQAKAQAIWLQIQEQTQNAQGDALKTYDSTANRIDRMGQSWKQSKESLGSFLIEGLAVDEMVSGLASAMNFLVDNAHQVRLGFDAVTNSLTNFISKAIVFTKGSAERLALEYQQIFAGDKEFKALEARIEKSFKDQQTMMKGVDSFTDKRDKDAVRKFNKVEESKRKEGRKTADQAIKDAIKATAGTGKSGGVISPTSSSKADRSSDLSGAFEKGSVDAFRIEKSSQGNRTERDNLKWNKRTAQALESASTPTILTIAP